MLLIINLKLKNVSVQVLAPMVVCSKVTRFLGSLSQLE